MHDAHTHTNTVLALLPSPSPRNTLVHAHVHAHTPAATHSCMHTRLHPHAHAHTATPTRPCTHGHTHTPMHKHAHPLMHMHTTETHAHHTNTAPPAPTALWRVPCGHLRAPIAVASKPTTVRSRLPNHCVHHYCPPHPSPTPSPSDPLPPRAPKQYTHFSSQASNYSSGVGEGCVCQGHRSERDITQIWTLVRHSVAAASLQAVLCVGQG